MGVGVLDDVVGELATGSVRVVVAGGAVPPAGFDVSSDEGKEPLAPELVEVIVGLEVEDVLPLSESKRVELWLLEQYTRNTPLGEPKVSSELGSKKIVKIQRHCGAATRTCAITGTAIWRGMRLYDQAHEQTLRTDKMAKSS